MSRRVWQGRGGGGQGRLRGPPGRPPPCVVRPQYLADSPPPSVRLCRPPGRSPLLAPLSATALPTLFRRYRPQINSNEATAGAPPVRPIDRPSLILIILKSSGRLPRTNDRVTRSTSAHLPRRFEQPYFFSRGYGKRLRSGPTRRRRLASSANRGF